MPATAVPNGRRFVTAPPYGQGELWLDKILAIRPVRTEVVATRVGEAEATIAHVIEVLDDCNPLDHGERAIFWNVVRGQLRAASPEAPWIAGRLVKVGNAFRLDQLSAEEESDVEACLAVADYE